MEINWLKEDHRTKTTAADTASRHEKLASDRLAEIGRLKAELQRLKMQISESGSDQKTEQHLSVQSLHDQIRMRDSIINCLQQVCVCMCVCVCVRSCG